MAYGAPLQAKAFAEQNYLALRQEYFASWLEMAKNARKLVDIAEQWQKPDSGLDLSVVYAWLSSWLCDIVRLAYGAEASLLSNPDLHAALLPIAKRIDLIKLFAYYDKVIASKALLSTPLNKQLLIEELLIEWWQLNHA